MISNGQASAPACAERTGEAGCRARTIGDAFTAALIALSLASAVLTLARLGVLPWPRPPLDAQLDRAADAVFPPPPAASGPVHVFEGRALAVPDEAAAIPRLAVELDALRERTESAMARYVISRRLRGNAPAKPGEGPALEAVREWTADGRAALAKLMRTDAATAGELLAVLGWPWAPADLSGWEPDMDSIGFSIVPEPLRHGDQAALRRRLARLGKAGPWERVEADLVKDGMSQEEARAMRVWACRLALRGAFESRDGVRRARAELELRYQLARFQSGWLQGLWSARWLVSRGRVALPRIVALYEERPAALPLVVESCRRADLDAQARRALEGLWSREPGAAQRAERELVALGPFALGPLREAVRAAAPSGRDTAPADRAASVILSRWPEGDMEDGRPAPRPECWRRWLAEVRPWL